MLMIRSFDILIILSDDHVPVLQLTTISDFLLRFQFPFLFPFQSFTNALPLDQLDSTAAFFLTALELIRHRLLEFAHVMKRVEVDSL